MRFTIVFIAVVFSSFSMGQVDTIAPKMLEFEYDSCDVAVWDIHFKETSTALDDSSYPSRMLAQSRLSTLQSEQVIKALKDLTSYDGTRANLTHHDLEVKFYHSGKAIAEVKISAMTGNIDIYILSEEYYFRNNCSESFGKYLIDLLNEFGIIELIEYDEIDLEGLRPISD